MLGALVLGVGAVGVVSIGVPGLTQTAFANAVAHTVVQRQWVGDPLVDEGNYVTFATPSFDQTLWPLTVTNLPGIASNGSGTLTTVGRYASAISQAGADNQSELGFDSNTAPSMFDTHVIGYGTVYVYDRQATYTAVDGASNPISNVTLVGGPERPNVVSGNAGDPQITLVDPPQHLSDTNGNTWTLKPGQSSLVQLPSGEFVYQVNYNYVIDPATATTTLTDTVNPDGSHTLTDVITVNNAVPNTVYHFDGNLVDTTTGNTTVITPGSKTGSVDITAPDTGTTAIGKIVYTLTAAEYAAYQTNGISNLTEILQSQVTAISPVATPDGTQDVLVDSSFAGEDVPVSSTTGWVDENQNPLKPQENGTLPQDSFPGYELDTSYGNGTGLTTDADGNQIWHYKPVPNPPTTPPTNPPVTPPATPPTNPVPPTNPSTPAMPSSPSTPSTPNSPTTPGNVPPTHNVTTVWKTKDGVVLEETEDGKMPPHSFDGYVLVDTTVDAAGNTTHRYALATSNKPNKLPDTGEGDYSLVLSLAGVISVGAAAILAYAGSNRKKELARLALNATYRHI